MKTKPVYLDYNATTPIDPRVLKVMHPYLYEHFGNPSSSHPYGVATKQAIEKARRQLADLLRCRPSELFFTSGGTESNNTAIKGIASAYRHRGNHIITSSIEHPAVHEPCQYLEGLGYEITRVPVNQYGQIDPDEVRAAIKPNTILISIMHANNEVGTVQPIMEISHIAHEANVLVHTDAAQSVGKIPVNVNDLGVDLLSVAGHKLYAPKGVGALFVREGVDLPKFMHGASHERNQRAGTENVIEIVGLGEAATIAAQELETNNRHMREMRDKLWKGLAMESIGSRLNGHPIQRLPNTLNVSFREVRADDLLFELWDEVAASAGAACHSEGVTVSTVLQAMEVPLPFAMGTIRFSTGKYTTPQEIDRAINAVSKAIRKIRSTDA